LTKVNSAASILQGVSGNIETRARTREMEVPSLLLNTENSAARNLQKSLRNIEIRARTRELEVNSLE
jgi:hypothetical protein